MDNQQPNCELTRKVFSHKCTAPIKTIQSAIKLLEDNHNATFETTIISKQTEVLLLHINTTAKVFDSVNADRLKLDSESKHLLVQFLQLFVQFEDNDSDIQIREALKEVVLKMAYKHKEKEKFEASPIDNIESDEIFAKFKLITENEKNKMDRAALHGRESQTDYS